jgi:uncharacterized membrane protein
MGSYGSGGVNVQRPTVVDPGLLTIVNPLIFTLVVVVVFVVAFVVDVRREEADDEDDGEERAYGGEARAQAEVPLGAQVTAQRGARG